MMIEINGVSRLFGQNTAVDEVSFSIERGEIIGLLGHNGAGKTTLMKMITGFLEPSAGEIKIDGQVVQGGVTQSLPNIGYLPESLPLYPEMTVIDYLDYAAELRGVLAEQKAEQIRQAIAKTELSDKAFQIIGTLSRGYQQRVGVAQALLNDPKILILDEPTNGLDPAQTQHMRDLITSLKQHATVIVSTHILQEVKAICDRVVILNQGRLALDAAMAELNDSHQVLLKTDAEEGKLKGLLDSLASIKKIELLESAEGRCRYQLSLDGNDNTEDCIAQIVKLVSAEGLNIYSAEPVQFDLEAMFHNINQVASDVTQQAGGLEHAA